MSNEPTHAMLFTDVHNYAPGEVWKLACGVEHTGGVPHVLVARTWLRSTQVTCPECVRRLEIIDASLALEGA